MTWVYDVNENGTEWQIGFYTGDKFNVIDSVGSELWAMRTVNYLNGGTGELPPWEREE